MKEFKSWVNLAKRAAPRFLGNVSCYQMRIILSYEPFNCNISQEPEVEVNPVIRGKTVESVFSLKFHIWNLEDEKMGKISI